MPGWRIHTGAKLIIDGSNGGGQVLRTALALSTITGKAFTINNIRQARPQPGLKAQHLAGIEALEELSFASVGEAVVGSSSIEFTPGKVHPQTLSIDIGTAGSITLLMQSLLLPCCLAGKVRLKIKGGTDVAWSPPIDYFLNVILPHFEQLAVFKVNEMKRGFYPKGGGFLDITIKPKQEGFKPLELDKRQPIDKIKGISAASSSLRHAEVAERQARAAKKKLSGHFPVKIMHDYQETKSPGTVITLWAGGIGSDALGAPRKRSEAVGAEAAGEMLYTLLTDAAVDNHLADNLIPLLGLVGGRIRTDDITSHIKTNIEVCEKFGMKFSVDDGVIAVDKPLVL